jgi:hypothetical protein
MLSSRALLAGDAPSGEIARSVHPPAIVLGGLAAAWLASTVAIPLPGSPVLAGAGFVASVVITGVALATWALTRGQGLLDALHENRASAIAAGLLVAAYLVSTLAAGAPREGLVASVRVVAIGAFGVAVVCANRAHALETAFARSALVLLTIYAVLLAAGWVFPAVAPYVFLTLPHQHLANVPRFAALTGTPGSTGAWALLALGLVGSSRRHPIARAAHWAGALAALATFSSATLALPAVIAAATMKRGRARVLATFALAAAGILPLYVHVLTIELGANQITVSRLHPSYEVSGLGPELMPVHEARALGAGVRFHFTAYAALAVRAASCFAEHPLTGVGPRRFEEACPVVTMNTYGEWSARRRPHNQFLELVVELGLVGVALVAAAVWLVTQNMRWDPPDRWYAAAAIGIVVCSCAADLLISLPVAGFFALHLRPRGGGAG